MSEWAWMIVGMYQRRGIRGLAETWTLHARALELREQAAKDRR